MIQLADLPLLNATLNGISFILIMAGYACIRRGRVTAHKRLMVSAFCVSVFFLISHLTYRFLGEEKKFGGQGWIRPIYFFILITHVVLAASVPVLATRTLYLALSGRFAKHRRIARVTFPIWVYVSITGVLVYLLLFRLYRPAPVVSYALGQQVAFSSSPGTLPNAVGGSTWPLSESREFRVWKGFHLCRICS